MTIIKDNWRFLRIVKLIAKVIKTGDSSSMSGSMNKIFENSFARTVGAKYAIAFNSGTNSSCSITFAWCRLWGK